MEKGLIKMSENNITQGRLVEVDLNTRRSVRHTLSAEDMTRFVGGGGLNAWLLYNQIDSDTNPLSPENPLIFGAGPLVGTGFPTGARSTATSLSPLTGIYGDSNGGGVWGVMMRRAGIDHLVITGALTKPGYLFINAQGQCSIEDASDLWGLDTIEAEKALKAKHPNAVAAVIGPAGENQVRYANIMFEKNAHSFSRAGMGAVMGSKKLKAIVLTPGKEKITKHDAAALKICSEDVKTWSSTLAFPRLFTRYGTMMFIHMVEALGLMYADNWRRKISPQDIDPIDAHAYSQAAKSKDTGCFRCPLKCGKQWRILDGRYAGEEGHGYEVAYIITLGLTLGLRSVEDILHLANRINRQGYDINEFCGAVGMLNDAHARGMVDRKDLNGLKPGWGEVEAIEELVDRTAERQGIGNILAQGTRGAAMSIGGRASKYALHMKGMHWPAHSAPPFVMAFSVSPRGGDFLKGIPYLLLQAINAQNAKLLFGATARTMDFNSHADKGRAVWWHENYKLLQDSLGTCFYLSMTLLAHGKLLPTHFAQAWHAAQGVETDGAQIQIAAERGYQIQRAINTLRGMDRRDDSYTKRPEPDSWARGIDLNRKGMLEEYYAYRGLSDDGLPTAERLAELGLDEVAQRLEVHGRLGKLNGHKSYLPLAGIIRNPDPAKFGKGLKAKIQNRVRAKVMAKMAENSENLKQQFMKIGDKRRRKEGKRNGALATS